MEMYQNLGKFLDNYESPFFVGSLVEKKVLFINKKAKELFNCTAETCDFEKIFERPEERMVSLITRGLESGKTSRFYNFVAVTGAQEKIVVDLQLGFFNEEKTEMFLDIIPQNDTRLQMALHQIQNSPRAEAVLNLDEKLSIVDCNQAFHKVFESSEELRHSHFKNDLVNGFLPEIRENLLADIHKTLETSEIFSREVKVFTATGEEKWYRFDLQKRDLDNSGPKLMCYMVNIEKQIETKENFDLVNQYLSAVQETTVDLLYRVDIATNTMYSYHEFQNVASDDRVIPDYVNTFFDKDTIHPDDKEIYLKGFRDFYENDIPCSAPVRFSLGGSPYQWYKITGKKIFDKDGNLTEVFGTLVNVDNEVNMQEEVSSFNQYFEALQSISGESFYSVDVKNKTLTQKGQVAEELGLVDVVENFPESLLHKVYPEDLELYKTFTYNSMKGIAGETRIRVLTTQGVFQWYEILCQIIRDETGGVSEVVGKMNNIHKEMTIQEEVSTLHKYFDVLKDLTDESLYFYDIKTNKLRLGGLTEKELGLPTEIDVYPDFIFPYIHPDDLEKFQKFDGHALDSGRNRLELRFKNLDGTYQWYELLSDIIHDDDGNKSEIFGRIKNVQPKHKLESEIEEANNYLLVMQELSDDILYRIDIEAKTLVYTTKTNNGAIITNTFENYPDSTFEKHLMHPEDEKIILEQTDQWLSGNMLKYKIRMKLVTEDYEWYEDSAITICDEDGKVTEIYGRLKNIHVEETMVAEVSTLNQYVEAVQSLSGESLYYVDVKTRILRQKGEVAVELGVPDEIPNYPEGAYPFIFPEHLEDFKIFAQDTLSGKPSSIQCKVMTATREYQWYEMISMRIYDKTGEMVEIFGRITNIQDKKDLQQKATHDLMTKVLNKVSFEEEAEDVMQKLRPDGKHALIFIDLDDFKGVNDKLGHGYGDVLLTTVGKRLKRHVREGDLVGRIGGDEFAVMLCNIGDEQSVLDRTNSMLESVKRNFSHEGISVGIKASVGVAAYPLHGTNYKDLIGKSDIAVYESKRQGKNVVSMYSEELEQY